MEIVIEIVSGEGGADSKIFVKELTSMYMKYAHLINLTASILATQDGHTTLKISGNNPWMAFCHEPGKHVCQRIPITESSGRRHTSLVSVAVLPIKKDISKILKDEDVKVETCGGHGPGGQHQNKSDSAVRMKHLPTGITVFINGKSQHANRREARRILSARVVEANRIKADVKYSKSRRIQLGDGCRGDKVRTYNFIDSRVVDHKLGRKTHQIRRVMRGELWLILGTVTKNR